MDARKVLSTDRSEWPIREAKNNWNSPCGRPTRTDGLRHGVCLAVLIEALGEGMLLLRACGGDDGVGGLALGLALQERKERHLRSWRMAERKKKK